MSLPSPGRRRLVTFLAIFPWALLLIEFLLFVPRYDKLFQEHAFEPPAHTDILMSISRWVNDHAVAAFLITFALMAVSLGIAHTAQTMTMSPQRRAMVLLIVFGIPCLLFLLTWLGVSSTHRTLVESLKN